MSRSRDSSKGGCLTDYLVTTQGLQRQVEFTTLRDRVVFNTTDTTLQGRSGPDVDAIA